MPELYRRNRNNLNTRIKRKNPMFTIWPEVFMNRKRGCVGFVVLFNFQCSEGILILNFCMILKKIRCAYLFIVIIIFSLFVKKKYFSHNSLFQTLGKMASKGTRGRLSLAVRSKIAEYRAKKMSIGQILQTLRHRHDITISRKTIYNVLKRVAETGNVAPKQRTGTPSHLEPLHR